MIINYNYCYLIEVQSILYVRHSETYEIHSNDKHVTGDITYGNTIQTDQTTSCNGCAMLSILVSFQCDWGHST